MNKGSLVGFFVSLILHCTLFSFFIDVKSEFKSVHEEKVISISMSKIRRSQPQPAIIEPEPVREQIVEEKIVKKVVEEKKKPEPVRERIHKKIPEKIVKKEVKTQPKIQEPVLDMNDAREFTQDSVQSSDEINAPNDSGEAAQSGGEFDIRALIKEIIAKYASSHYPSGAKRRRQIGIVGIRFTYKSNGVVDNLSVVKSSGFELLDEAALNAVQKTKSKFPKINGSKTYTFSVKYNLI